MDVVVESERSIPPPHSWRIMGFGHEGLIRADSHTCHLLSISLQLPLRSWSQGSGHIKKPRPAWSRSLFFCIWCVTQRATWLTLELRARTQTEPALADACRVSSQTALSFHNVLSRPANWGHFRFSTKTYHRVQGTGKRSYISWQGLLLHVSGHYLESHATVKQSKMIQKRWTRGLRFLLNVDRHNKLPSSYVRFNISQTIRTHFALFISPAVTPCYLKVQVKQWINGTTHLATF